MQHSPYRDTASYFTALPTGVECLSATLSQHRYPPHAHDSFVIGALSRGVGSITIRGRLHQVRPGDLTLYDPQEVHDGAPLGNGFSYRVSYPPAALLREIAHDASQGRQRGMPSFRSPVVHDPAGAAHFLRAHRLWQRGGCPLQAEESMLAVYRHCLNVHAGVRLAEAGGENQAVARVMRLLSERFAEKLTLQDLAAEARLPRQRLISAFVRRTGLAPHAYLVDQRVHAAKALLRAGTAPAAAASAAGFSDQAHLTRLFKARVGVTPGVYRAAFSPRGMAKQARP